MSSRVAGGARLRDRDVLEASVSSAVRRAPWARHAKELGP
jgi:hypothetical protein